MSATGRHGGVALSSALAGSLVCAVIAFAPVRLFAQVDLIEQLLLLGPLVGIPLGLSLSTRGALDPSHAKHLRWLCRAQPALAPFAVASVFVPRGTPGALCSLPWVLFTLAVATLGLARFVARALAHRWSPARALRDPAFALDAALLYLPVGGAWHLLARAGLRPLGFDDAIVRLTAVHFHFAGWVAPLFAARVLVAMQQRDEVAPRWALGAMWGAVLGPAMVGVGITVSQITTTRMSELVSALALASCLWVLGAATLSVARRGVRSPAARGLLNASSATLGLTMVLAVAYAYARVTHGPWPTIPFMARWHGVANAVGYALFGLLGWSIEDVRESRESHRESQESAAA
jgi:hypothetical protein